MINVKDLKKDIFPLPFLEYLPETCDYCDSPNEVIETFSFLQCSNKHCISKMAYCLLSLIKELGILELTINDCIDFLQRYETLNPYRIFLYRPEEGVICESKDEEQSLAIYEELNKKRNMLLWEYIRLGNFENLGESIEKIFKDYTDISMFFEDLKTGGISFIQNLLLKDTTFEDIDSISVMAVLIYESLLTYREDILEGIKGVNIINPEIKIGILFANNCSKFKSNKDFLLSLNKKLKNKIYLYELYSLNVDVSLVYWEDSKTNVYNSLIKEANEKNKYVVNMTNIFDKILEMLSEDTHE